MRGNLAGQEADLVEFKRVLGQIGKVQVAKVDWIESSAEEGDGSRCNHSVVEISYKFTGFKHGGVKYR